MHSAPKSKRRCTATREKTALRRTHVNGNRKYTGVAERHGQSVRGQSQSPAPGREGQPRPVRSEGEGEGRAGRNHSTQRPEDGESEHRPEAAGPEEDERHPRRAGQGRHRCRRRDLQGLRRQLQREVQVGNEEVTTDRTNEREGAVMRVQKVARGVAASVAAMLVAGTVAPVVRAAGDKPETLIYAVYNGQDTASQVF